MIVYKFTYECGLCHKTATAYTYVHYLRDYEDVQFPYENWMMDEVYALTHLDNQYFDRNVDIPDFPVKILGDDPVLDERIVRSGRFPTIQKRKTIYRPECYYANCCEDPSCKGMYGNDYLRKYIIRKYLKDNIAMPVECEI